MRILADHCVSARIVDHVAEFMPNATVVKAIDVNADKLLNGDLHSFAETEGVRHIGEHETVYDGMLAPHGVWSF